MTLDSQRMSSVLEQFPSQCRKALELPKGMYISESIQNIVVLGMGGSGIVGDLTKAIMHNQSTPVFVVRDYSLPQFVGKNSLVFAVSYSGKTEETVEALKEAIRRKAKIIGISTGGEVQTLCRLHIRIPTDLQPRCALGYLFLPILGVLVNSKLLDIPHSDVTETLSLLGNVDEFKERAKTMVKLLKGRIPLIYSSELLRPAAMRWKTQFNENAKIPAFFNTFSEMTHNEICSLEAMKRSEMVAIMLRDGMDHAHIQKRMQLCKEIMKGTIDVIEVAPRGTSLLARLLSCIYLGDWVSYYTAMERGADPTPVFAIEDLKKRMSS